MKKTAEAVSLGHPDKMADYISSYILDRMIEQDAAVKYAVEVMVKDNTVVLGGEITGDVNLARIMLSKRWRKSGTISFTAIVGEITPLIPRNCRLSILLASSRQIFHKELNKTAGVIRVYLLVTLVRVRVISAANNIWPKNYATPYMSMLCKTSTWALTSKRRLH